MSLRRRLERLEGGSRPCPECGHGSGEYEYVVEWPGFDDPPTPEPPPCGTCGRPSEIVVDFSDAPTPEEHARLEARMFEHAREHPELYHLEPPIPDYPPDTWGEDEGGGA